MESIVDKIRSRIDLLNTLYPHEHGRYYVDHEYGGYKLFFATAYSEEKCLVGPDEADRVYSDAGRAHPGCRARGGLQEERER